MPKRRRERDRPKAAPDAAYNPNKRVLLSYESDDEPGNAADDHATAPEHLESLHASKSHYEITTYQDDDNDDVSVGQTEISVPTQVEENENNEQENSEHSQEADTPRRSGTVRRNPTTNQLPALGSLSYQWDEDGDYDYGEEDVDDTEEDEAMAYLRAVRSERQTLPTVFRAASTDEHKDVYESGIGDSRGFLDDDAFIGRSLNTTDHNRKTNQSKDPQEAYNDALKTRFLLHRAQVHAVTDGDATHPPDEKHPTRIDPTKRAHSQWIYRLKHSVPLPAQVRTFNQDTVFRLLELVRETHLVKCSEISNIASVWIWSLLARLDSVGGMNNDQVSLIREFGKQAVLVLVSLRDPAIARQLEAVNNANNNTNETGVEGDTASEIPTNEVAEQDTESTKLPENPLNTRENTLVTLDMILTIVGDVFGQRDLLEFRRKWEIEDRH